MRGRVCSAAVTALIIGLSACTSGPVTPHPATAPPLASGPAPDATLAATKIKHVVVVMQENRSFDSYFGTYPGADGIPMAGATPSVCVPDPAGGCQRPFHDTADVNGGGPHGQVNCPRAFRMRT